MIWAAPVSKAELTARFQVTEALKQSAAAKRWPEQDVGAHEEWSTAVWGRAYQTGERLQRMLWQARLWLGLQESSPLVSHPSSWCKEECLGTFVP